MNSEDEEALGRLLGSLAETVDAEVDCEQALEGLAVYFEALESGKLEGALVKVDQHLKVCPCCAQELAALARALRSGEL